MAHIGHHKEKKSYVKESKYNLGRRGRNKSIVQHLSKAINEIIFEIHEFKTLGFDNKEIKRRIENAMTDAAHYWYTECEMVENCKKEYNYHIITPLYDKIWVRIDYDSHVKYWIE